MIIDKTYFQGHLKIPNSQDGLTPLSDRIGNKVNLDDYIIRYEKEVMVFALGYAEYKSFISSFDVDGTILGGAEQRWIDFINGLEYSVDGELFKWDGLRFKQGNQDYSLIADYVYSIFLPDVSNTFGSAGVQKNNAKASRGYSSIPRTVEAWNSFIERYQGDDYQTSVARFVKKGNLIGLDYSNSRESNYAVSMYQFLQDKSDIYNAVTVLFKPENSFGL